MVSCGFKKLSAGDSYRSFIFDAPGSSCYLVDGDGILAGAGVFIIFVENHPISVVWVNADLQCIVICTYWRFNGESGVVLVMYYKAI